MAVNSNLFTKPVRFSERALHVFGSFIQKIFDSYPYTRIGREKTAFHPKPDPLRRFLSLVHNHPLLRTIFSADIGAAATVSSPQFFAYVFDFSTVSRVADEKLLRRKRRGWVGFAQEPRLPETRYGLFTLRDDRIGSITLSAWSCPELHARPISSHRLVKPILQRTACYHSRDSGDDPC